MRVACLSTATALALALAGCAGERPPLPDVTEDRPEPLVDAPIDDPSGVIGPGGGAALGSIIGSGGGAKAAVLTGLAIGYALRGSSGPGLSGNARSAQRDAMRQVMTVPLGTRLTWRSPPEKARGTITPVEEFTDDKGRRCRRFTETRVVRAQTGQFAGTACERAS